MFLWNIIQELKAIIFKETCNVFRGICMLTPDAGACRGNELRYFFNRGTNKCETFMYGGCSGNENNFEVSEAVETNLCTKKI